MNKLKQKIQALDQGSQRSRKDAREENAKRDRNKGLPNQREDFNPGSAFWFFARTGGGPKVKIYQSGYRPQQNKEPANAHNIDR